MTDVDNTTEVVRVVFTVADVRDFADQYGVPVDLAIERALSWGKHIGDTLVEIGNDQLASVVQVNQP